MLSYAGSSFSLTWITPTAFRLPPLPLCSTLCSLADRPLQAPLLWLHHSWLAGSHPTTPPSSPNLVDVCPFPLMHSRNTWACTQCQDLHPGETRFWLPWGGPEGSGRLWGGNRETGREQCEDCPLHVFLNRIYSRGADAASGEETSALGSCSPISMATSMWGLRDGVGSWGSGVSPPFFLEPMPLGLIGPYTSFFPLSACSLFPPFSYLYPSAHN